MRRLSRLEEIIWYLFLFTLPFQTRIILWQEGTVFSEWRSISLFGTDLLFVALVGLWLVSIVHPHLLGRADAFLWLFFIFAAVSVLQYDDLPLGLYQLLRLGQGIIFFYYIKLYARSRFKYIYTFTAFLCGAFVQAVIAVSQFFLQGDLGLRWLGESVLLPTMQGVAVFFNFSGDKIMRAYGTFPHPNLLAAYLLISIFALYFIYLQKNQVSRSVYCLLPTAYCLLLFAFLLTFARTTIFVWLLVLGGLSIYFYRKRGDLWINWKKVLIFTVIICVLFNAFFWQDVLARILISSQEEAVQLRIFFNKEALGSGGEGWDINWFGVGIGNFVSWLIENRPGLNSYLYQPVHNVYLLIYSELGVFGLLAFVAFLFVMFKWALTDNRQPTTDNDKIKKPFLLLVVGCLLFVALFDHFPWTLQQGRLMFWGILALL